MENENDRKINEWSQQYQQQLQIVHSVFNWQAVNSYSLLQSMETRK